MPPLQLVVLPVQRVSDGMRNPVRFSRTPVNEPAQMRPAPALGEHTAELLAELGIDQTIDRAIDRATEGD